MAKKWFYQIDGKILGPVSRRVLREYVQLGQLSDQTLVWRKGLDDWLIAGKAECLLPLETAVYTGSPLASPAAANHATAAGSKLQENIRRYQQIQAINWPPTRSASAAAASTGHGQRTNGDHSQVPATGNQAAAQAASETIAWHKRPLGRARRAAGMIAQLAKCTAAHLQGLWTLATVRRRLRPLAAQRVRAQLQLGQRLAQLRLGSEAVLDRLLEIEEQLQQSQTGKNGIAKLKAEQAALHHHLAEELPAGAARHPLVAEEWKAHAAAEQKWQQHRAEVAELHRLLWQPDSSQKRTLVLGYAVLAMLLALSTYSILPASNLNLSSTSAPAVGETGAGPATN